jgi:hypothetical protein
MLRQLWWRLHHAWLKLRWWCDFERPLRMARTKFVRDGCMKMSKTEWGEWLDRLPSKQFLALMMVSEPAKPRRKRRKRVRVQKSDSQLQTDSVKVSC